MATYRQLYKVPIAFMIVVYNEESRIRSVLDHACRWADEVIIVNKSSSDNTKNICLEYGDRVKVIDIPFSLKGHEDTVSIVKYPVNDWIFIGTASEIPTFGLITKMRRVLDESNGQLDLVYVPRNMYSFGISSPRSPWAVCYYPFLVNRNRAIIANTVHDNFKPKSKINTRRIQYSNNCCVYHFTHPSAKVYLTDMMQYFEAEISGDVNAPKKFRDCISNINKYSIENVAFDSELFGLYCAWKIYWLGTALYLWEKQRGIDVLSHYKDLKYNILETEWKGIVGNANTVDNVDVQSALLMSFESKEHVKTEDDLLVELSRRKICQNIKVLYVVGAHRFQESELIFMMFPGLEKVYLFEPIPAFYEYLLGVYGNDSRIEIYPYAISDENEACQDNDTTSSSLLPPGEHLRRFPKGKVVGTIPVICRTLDSVINEHKLDTPDMLFIDAQGAEYKILSALPRDILSRTQLVYTKASKEEIYIGAGMLDDVKELLEPDYYFACFKPLNKRTLTHGNALFVNRKDAKQLLDRSDSYVIYDSGGIRPLLGQVKRLAENVFYGLKNAIAPTVNGG